MKQSDDLLRAQINALIRDEIQEGINEWIDEKDKEKSTGLGFAQKTVGDEVDRLKVNVPQAEVDKLIKKYKKIKRKHKSNIFKAKILDQHGKPLSS